jgi:hypothetical protein
MRDVQNVIAKVKRERVAGTTEAERLDTHIRSFVSIPGNWANVYVDKETTEARTVAFQSARMRKIFAAAPEVMMVDCSFGTNKSKYTPSTTFSCVTIRQASIERRSLSSGRPRI